MDSFTLKKFNYSVKKFQLEKYNPLVDSSKVIPGMSESIAICHKVVILPFLYGIPKFH